MWFRIDPRRQSAHLGRAATEARGGGRSCSGDLGLARVGKSPVEAKPSLLGCAILQRLARSPMSGYELKKLFTTAVGYGWRAYDTQIYRELKALEQNGLV